ncbi:MAG: sodium ion-translocating decarboxylase subunit beta [Bacillota bacterium]
MEYRLFSGLSQFTVQHAIMLIIAGTLLYLAIKKGYEPMLLLPIGFGTFLVNIPLSAAGAPDGWLGLIYRAGITTELFPILIFIGIGAMIDFGPLLSQPVTALLGLAAQLGIFATALMALGVGFSVGEAVSIGIIGAADGPTAIYVSTKLAPSLLAPISVAAYSYMALVPVIQPPIIRLLTNERERRIPAVTPRGKVSRTAKILFPIGITLAAGILAPVSTELIGALMFGNLLRESGVVDRLSNAAQNELSNLVTIFLGIAVGSTMTASSFLRPEALLILSMGLIAFALDTVAGVLFAKFLNLFLKQKINPMIGAAGISAFPMSARVVHMLGLKEDTQNFLLMQATGANVAGQVGSIIAGSILLTLVL